MRTLPVIGAVMFAALLALPQTANAARVCKERCEAGSCVKKCVQESEPDVVIRDRDRDRYREHDRRPGIDFHVPGVNVDIGH